MSCSHKHKVNETRARSFSKAIFGRIIEIAIGTLIFGTILSLLGFPSPYQLGFSLNVLEELLCFTVTYFTERIWNKIDWGRNIEDVEDQTS